MDTILIIVAAVGWLAALLVIWALCRTAARADRWAKEQRKEPKP